MTARCYSRRILAPLHGTLQVVSVPHGDGGSTDGVHWVLYVMHEAIVVHTGLSEIRDGTRHRDSGITQAAIRGTARSHLIEEVGARLVAALEAAAGRVPIMPAYHCECWLLDADQDRPSALLESAVSECEPPPMEHRRCVPGQGARKDFVSRHEGAERLSAGVAEAACRACWLYRDARGGGSAADGCAWPVEQFPPLLLRERWSQPNQAIGTRLSRLAGPLAAAIDRAGPGSPSLAGSRDLGPCPGDCPDISVVPPVVGCARPDHCRVKARSLADEPPAQWEAEPFLPFHLE